MAQPSVAYLQRQCPLSIDRSRARRAGARAAAAARLARRMHGSAASLVAVSLVVATVGADLASGEGSRLRAVATGAGSPLSAGSRGAGVAALQRKLGVPVDGVYGSRTVTAVGRFQQRRGLEADGVAGPATLAALGIRRAQASDAATGGKVASTASSPGGPAVRAPSAMLAKIASCESGGNAQAVSADGRYRGKYQFSRQTWRRMGGRGDPARADEAVQDRMAAKLLATAGPSAWPSCA